MYIYHKTSYIVNMVNITNTKHKTSIWFTFLVIFKALETPFMSGLARIKVQLERGLKEIRVHKQN